MFLLVTAKIVAVLKKAVHYPDFSLSLCFGPGSDKRAKREAGVFASYCCRWLSP